MAANGWREAVAPRILEYWTDFADATPMQRRRSWTPEGFDGAERQQTAAPSETEDDKFRTIVEQLCAGIYVVAADGNVAYVNPSFARQLGYEPDEVIGRPMLTFVAESKERPRPNASRRN